MLKKLALILACAAACGGALAQTKWDLPSGYGPNTFQVQNLQWFADEVDKATAGKLKLTLHPGASLFKANEIKRAVQTGQTQIGEFILSGAANENALFGVDSIPFLATTYPAAKKLDAASRPALDKLLASQGMKLLYTVPWPGQSLYSGKRCAPTTRRRHALPSWPARSRSPSSWPSCRRPWPPVVWMPFSPAAPAVWTASCMSR